jgi:hypothetical protein
MGSGTVAIRAFRGTRRTSVYREHVLGEDVFGRIVAAGGRGSLPIVASLGVGRRELRKEAAHRLADELYRLRAGGDLLDADDDLVAAAEIASWCARSREDAWLRIVRI